MNRPCSLERKIDRILDIVERMGGASGFGTDLLANVLGNLIVGK